VELKEKPSSELSFSVGYGTVEKARGRMGLNTINLAGTARKAGLNAEANFIRQGVSLSFSEPWTLGTRWQTDLSISGHLRQEPSYHAEVIGGKLTLGRSIGTYTRVGLSYRFENTNLTEVEVSSTVEELDPRIRSLTLNLSYDSRDNLFNPSSGWYASWSSEIAGSFLQGSNTFDRSVVMLKTFHSAGRNTVLASALEVGWMQAFGDDEEVPLSERFFTGGPTSLRGFGYQRVGPLDAAGQPLGGRFKLIWNLIEIRQSIYKMIGAVVFLEIGNVWSQSEEFRVDDMRADIGCGLRVNSPLGIIRLDYGINVDRRYDESRAKMFFSMGQAF
jgi:outer membrane protein insertion porin family